MTKKSKTAVAAFEEIKKLSPVAQLRFAADLLERAQQDKRVQELLPTVQAIVQLVGLQLSAATLVARGGHVG